VTRLDLLLLAMVAVWGANYSLIKVALREFPELPFNALRLVIGSAICLAVLWWQRREESGPGPAPLSRNDWIRLAVLGVIGHLCYQLLYLAGLQRTSVGNGSLILGTTPILVALMTAWTGHERVPPMRWVGATISFIGLAIVVGKKVDWHATSHLGDLLFFLGTVCWATYSVGSVPLLKTRSPLLVTGYSMGIGAVLYTMIAIPSIATLEWSRISGYTWALTLSSAVFALAFGYLIWYTSVQRAGTTRTAAWSNVTPVFATAIAALWIGEPVGANQVLGSLAIFTGLFITRRT
jgi:drug/metabolite transporter (DMT)-like permease